MVHLAFGKCYRSRFANALHLKAVEGSGGNGNRFASDDFVLHLRHPPYPRIRLGRKHSIACCPFSAHVEFEGHVLIIGEAKALPVFLRITHQIQHDCTVIYDDFGVRHRGHHPFEPASLLSRDRVKHTIRVEIPHFELGIGTHETLTEGVPHLRRELDSLFTLPRKDGIEPQLREL